CAEGAARGPVRWRGGRLAKRGGRSPLLGTPWGAGRLAVSDAGHAREPAVAVAAGGPELLDEGEVDAVAEADAGVLAAEEVVGRARRRLEVRIEVLVRRAQLRALDAALVRELVL